jgi:hypothetical protein
LADQQTAKLHAVASARLFRATVTTVTAGGASDGHALVKITYRGTEMPVADYPDSYTPATGHRVLCALVDRQPSILHHGIGYP